MGRTGRQRVEDDAAGDEQTGVAYGGGVGLDVLTGADQDHPAHRALGDPQEAQRRARHQRRGHDGQAPADVGERHQLDDAGHGEAEAQQPGGGRVGPDQRAGGVPAPRLRGPQPREPGAQDGAGQRQHREPVDQRDGETQEQGGHGDRERLAAARDARRGCRTTRSSVDVDSSCGCAERSRGPDDTPSGVTDMVPPGPIPSKILVPPQLSVPVGPLVPPCRSPTGRRIWSFTPCLTRTSAPESLGRLSFEGRGGRKQGRVSRRTDKSHLRTEKFYLPETQVCEDVREVWPDRCRSAVEQALGALEALGEQRLDGVRGPVDLERQLLALGRGVVRQHEVGGACRPGGRPMPTRTR